MRRSFPLIVVLSLGIGAADAAVVKVSKNGALTTIQAGVDAAAAGDTVLVAAGVYTETVDVPAGKDGLTIKGAGKVVLDARGPAGAAAGAGINVLSDDVTVRDLEIRNAATSLAELGDGIRFLGDRGRVTKCAVIGCETAGVVSFGDDARIVGSRCVANEVGILAASASGGLEITKVVFEFNTTHAIELLDGARADVAKCVIRGGLTGVRGSQLNTNAGVRIVACKFEHVRGNVVVLNAPNLLIEKCSIKRGGGGINVRGDGVVIRNNVIDGAASNSSTLAVRNAVGVSIEGNQIRSVGGPAIDIAATVTDAILVANVVRRSHTALNGAAFLVEGNDCQLVDCFAIDAAGDGFLVTGDSVSLEGCLALRCGTDGLDIDATAADAKLDACVAKLCGAEGLDNGGPSTVASSDVEVTGLTVRSPISNVDPGNGIVVSGNRPRIRNCRFFACDFRCVETTGADPVIEDCKFVHCGTGIRIAGSGLARVDDCSFEQDFEAIQFDGPGSAIVDGCSFTNLSGDGVNGDLVGTLDVVGCAFKDVALDCVDVAVGDTVTVRKNTIRDCNATVIVVGLSAIGTVSGNSIQRCGTKQSVGILVASASDVIVRDNALSRLGGDAIRIELGIDNIEVSGNTIKDCVRDGIDVGAQAVGVAVVDNVVRRCLAEGIENSGTNSTITGNDAKQCRLDLANDGTATFTANVFTTGGENVAPEID
ncbi:MAG: right-handed parallel beta-helix repeat-containing protein [Planctomycetes bacterium]|nr:right-handed parallel beta-helix repeat-containing protein [Planctomycetota bacterium]